MTKLPNFLFRCSLIAFAPVAAHAAGTYYNGAYQSPQQSYAQQTYAQRQQNMQNSYMQRSNPAYASTRYNTSYNNVSVNSAGRRPQNVQQQSSQPAQKSVRASDEGFYLNAGLSRQVAMWQFEMKESKSILHYDNINWNVFDIDAGYKFTAANTPMQVNAGFKYGMQSGDSTMIDDDITNGGYFSTTWYDSVGDYIADQFGHALSIGTSSGGNMYEFNLGFGLTDFFKWGNVKITPSVGYRYLKYKLETEKNYGLAVDTLNANGACITIDGEQQCDPVVIIYTIDANGDAVKSILLKRQVNSDGSVGLIPLPNGLDSDQYYVNNAGTYYYQQPGTSHSYEVEWSGPYVALDMDYTINPNNAVNGHVELGLPGYTATGDQPYRIDWQHPKSVEDKAGIGSAYHIGLGANWKTAITNTVSLSVGLTYDYYNVSDADANTYLNASYYEGVYNDRLDVWKANGYTEDQMLYGIKDANGDYTLTPDPTAVEIVKTKTECPGWVCKSDGEIESFYKSMGIRVGINARF